MEHEVMEDSEGEEPTQELRRHGESDEDYLARLLNITEDQFNSQAMSLVYSQELELGPQVALLALHIADSAERSPMSRFTVSTSLPAASVYIASHILNQPRSLSEVAGVADVSERNIYSVYRGIYHESFELIDEDWRRLVGGTTLYEAAEALFSLPWPPSRYEVVDSENENEEDRGGRNYSGIPTLVNIPLTRELCFEFHLDRDSRVDPHNRIWPMAQNIALQMRSIGPALQMRSVAPIWNTINPWTIAAACTYMASYLVFQRKTVEDVSAISGVPPAAIRNTYQAIHRLREQIVREEWYEHRFLTRTHALSCLPEP